MEKSPRSKKRILLSCSIGLLLVSALLVLALHLANRDRLTVKATYHTDATFWAQNYDDYAWETPKTLMLFGANTPGLASTKVRRYDTSRAATELLAPTLKHYMGIAGHCNRQRLSPNGEWLLVVDTSTFDFVAQNTKTKQQIKWKHRVVSGVNRNLIDVAGYLLWMSDCRRWIELSRNRIDGGVTPVIHSLDGPDRKARKITTWSDWPIGVTPEGHLLCATHTQPLIIWDYDLNPNPIPSQQHRVSLPTSDRIVEIEGSPDGKRIAYLVQENRTSSIPQWIARLLPLFARTDKKVFSVWISNVDGSKLRRIGYENVESAGALQWTPDGKKFSLFLDNTFYVVPVPND